MSTTPASSSSGLLVLGAKAVVVPLLIGRVVRHDPNSRETDPLVNVPVVTRGRRGAHLPGLRRHAAR